MADQQFLIPAAGGEFKCSSFLRKQEPSDYALVEQDQRRQVDQLRCCEALLLAQE